VSSIRSKLSQRFAVLVVVAVAAFAVAVYAARQASVYAELQKDAELRGDIALQIVRQAGTASLVVGMSGPELVGVPRVALDAIPGYLVVLDQAGQAIYSSPIVRRLSERAQRDTVEGGDRANLAAFDAAKRRALEANAPIEFRLPGDRGVMIRREDFDGRRVVVGISRIEATVSWREMLGSAFLMLPVILFLAVGGAYLLTGDILTPVDRIRQEVEAITDGRSLHRRVAVEASDDEIERLTGTLNALIGRLEQSFGALRRFTADASHELKTPLAVLRADIERAMQLPATSNDQMVALEEALAQTTWMADLVDSLLTLARADEGRFDLHREPVPLEPLAREVMETAVILGEQAGLRVTMPEIQGLLVQGDRTRLRQLFLNLVTNAIKYTPEGGEVELALVRDDGNALFKVRDTGIGISAADLPHIFERFWRADRVRTRTSERGGSGLGLAISYWIAQAHGGQLSVQSRLHRGSTFTVSIPIADPDEKVTEAPADALGAARAASVT
jgi:signal transduction histidine kinase